MKKSLFIGLVILLGLTGCTRNQEIEIKEDGLSLYARTESPADTKTVVESGTHVFWEPGDEIAVFMGEKSAKFTTDLTSASASATFKGTFGDEAWPEELDLWAVYPFAEDAVFDGETITTTLPSEQIAREGSFGKDMNLSIAHSNSVSLQFYNVGGGIRFSVTEEGIKKVIFEGLSGEIISGKVKIGFEEGIPIVKEVTGGSQFITLLPPAGKETFAKDTWYYIVAIPGALEGGYKLRFYKDSDYARKVSEKAVEIKRSIYGNIEKADSGIEYESQTKSYPKSIEEYKESLIVCQNLASETNLIICRSKAQDGGIAPQSIANEIQNLENVMSAYPEESGKMIYVLQNDGTHFHLVLEREGLTFDSNQEDTSSELLFSPKLKAAATQETTDIIVPSGEKKALLLSPYQSSFYYTYDEETGKTVSEQRGLFNVNEPYIRGLLSKVGYSLRYLKNEEVKIDHFLGDTLAKYDLVMIMTHGGVNSYCTGRIDPEDDGFFDRIDESFYEGMADHWEKYVDGDYVEISVDNEWLEATTTHDYPNSIIYVGACHSYEDDVDLMHSYFHRHNAKVYSGFSGLVNYTFDGKNNQSAFLLYSVIRSLCMGMNYHQAISHIRDYDDIWTLSFRAFCLLYPYKFNNVIDGDVFLVSPYPTNLKSEVNNNLVTLIWDNPVTTGSYRYRVNVDGKWYTPDIGRAVTVSMPESGTSKKYDWYVEASLYYDGSLFETYVSYGEPFTISPSSSNEITLTSRTYDGTTYSIIRKNTSSTDYRVNGDGSKFYSCSYAIKAGDKTYDLPGTYYTYEDDRDFKDIGPAMAVDTSTGDIWAFLIEKDTDDYYGMCGYMFKISGESVSRQTLFTAANWGWFPFFGWEDDQLILYCFSYAGYYAIVALQDEDWTLYYAGDIYPDEFKSIQQEHDLIYIR